MVPDAPRSGRGRSVEGLRSAVLDSSPEKPMWARVASCAVLGLEGAVVEVEADIAQGLPSFTVVGLPDKAVQESRERVRSAIKNSGFSFPLKRLTVNLAPADLPKQGPAYDLPMALGILEASGQAAPNAQDSLFIGELSLDGGLRHVDGILPMVGTARDHRYKRAFVPVMDAPEAALIEGIEVYPVPDLAALVSHLSREEEIPAFRTNPQSIEQEDPVYDVDLSDVRGQEHAKRALEVAASGGHNLLMTGPPGAGKTLLARCLPGILPRMGIDEALDVTKIYSVRGLLPPNTPLLVNRPFRSPHHTISNAGLVGGGSWPKPGEISLAHNGVLFLDELPEFGQRVLEVLRQPMEDRVVSISRAAGTVVFPASFMMVGAMNPCPCGYFGDPVRECTDSLAIVTRYQKRLSGPLLDRIDIHVDVPRVEYEKLTGNQSLERSASVRDRVESARNRQRLRFEGTDTTTNGEMGPREVRKFCELDEAGRNLLRSAVRQLHLSARAFHRVLKLARTIADLAGEDEIAPAHLAEAIQYRPRRLI